MKHYIGLDAHSKTSTFVVLDTKGQEVTKVQVETTEKNLISVIRSIQGTKKLVFEEMNLSQWLYLLLKDEVDELIVCNPYYLGKKRQSKNDYNDARHLAGELRCGHITPVYHDDNPLIKMRVLISSYEDINRNCTSFKNRYKAIFRSRGVNTNRGRKFYIQREVIDELKEPEDHFVAKTLFKQIEVFEAQKLKFKEYFLDYKKNNPVVKNLTSIPGINAIRAVSIASIVCSPHRFVNKHKFWSYSMLVRHKEVSDGIVYRSVTRYGKDLKGIFLGAAESNLKTNSGLKKQYDQMCSKGLDRRKAKKAMARRIAAIALQVMKKGVKYDDKYLEKQRKIN